jgi:hypothetical protein
MSRGPGRIQREIATLIAGNQDDAWTISELCWRIYSRAATEKKHRVAVLRALREMELPPLW